MHEYASVESLVQSLLHEVQTKGQQRVQAVRVRRGATFSEEAVRQAFAALTLGTALEHAELKLEELVAPIQCGCGHRRSLNVTEQDGYPYLCPECGDLVEVIPGPDLELLEVVYGGPLKATAC